MDRCEGSKHISGSLSSFNVVAAYPCDRNIGGTGTRQHDHFACKYFSNASTSTVRILTANMLCFVILIHDQPGNKIQRYGYIQTVNIEVVIISSIVKFHF